MRIGSSIIAGQTTKTRAYRATRAWAVRGVLTAAIVSAAFAVVAPATATVGPPSSTVSHSKSPAALSLPLGTQSLDTTGRPAPAVCRRVRAVITQLGETFAGHRLRETLLQRHCPAHMARPGDDAVWRWPWQSLHAPSPSTPTHHNARHDLLPPVVLRETGGWQIRCGRAGLRQRCALARVEPANRLSPTSPPPPALVAHFVIDRLAGRSTPLFRLFAQRSADRGRDELRAVVFNSITGPVRVPFDACTPRGCMLEAPLSLATHLLDRLWDRQALTVHIETRQRGTIAPGHDPTVLIQGTIDADGFRAGMVELIGMDRGNQLASPLPTPSSLSTP